MSYTLVIADGGVASLIACMAAGCRAAAGPRGDGLGVLLPSVGEPDPRLIAARSHATSHGLEPASLQNPIESVAGEDGRLLHVLLEAALMVRARGGGEVIWPGTADGSVESAAMWMNRSLLVSQLVTLAMGPAEQRQVRVRAPYADLTDRQVADLAIDMDAPIWTCWWMSPAIPDDLRSEAERERVKWSTLMKESGWTGSLEARALVVVRPAAARSPGSRGVR